MAGTLFSFRGVQKVFTLQDNSHEAIIPPDTFDLVQNELIKRKRGSGVFGGMIFCGDCGALFGPKTWHSTDRYKRTIWQCNAKYRDKTPQAGEGDREKASHAGEGDDVKRDTVCTTPHVTEEEIKQAFEKVLSSLLVSKEEIIDNLRELVGSSGMDNADMDSSGKNSTGQLVLADCAAIESAGKDSSDLRALKQEEKRLSKELTAQSQRMQDFIILNAKIAQDQKAYNAKYEQMAAVYREIDGKLSAVQGRIREVEQRKREIRYYIRSLSETTTAVFSESLWRALVQKVTVYAGKRMVFRMMDGSEIVCRVKE